MVLETGVLILIEIVVFLIAVAVVSSFIIFILVGREIKKLNEVTNQKVDQKKTELNNEIQKLGQNSVSNQEILDFIDYFARSIFAERFKISNDLGYSEMKALFDRSGENKSSLFCTKMTEVRYSGSALGKSDLRTLVYLIHDILDDYEKVSEREMEEKIKNLRLGSIYILLNKIKNWEMKFPKINILAKQENQFGQNQVTLPDLPKPKQNKVKIIEKPLPPAQNKIDTKKEMKHLDNKKIESLDILDRIQNKITKIKEQKGIKNWPSTIR